MLERCNVHLPLGIANRPPSKASGPTRDVKWEFHGTKIGDIKIHPDHFNEVPTFKAVKRTNHVTWTCFNGKVVGIRCFFYSEKWSQTTIPLLTLWWACIDVKTIHLFFGNATKTSTKSTNVRTDHEAIWLINFDRSPRLTQFHFRTIPCYHWLSSGVIKHGTWKSAVSEV